MEDTDPTTTDQMKGATTMKMVIFKDLFGYAVTPEDNYNARIRDERKVTNCSAFSSAEEIIGYFCKYFNSKPEDFIIEEV